MWETLNKEYVSRKKNKINEENDKIPDWLERYIEYKFHLFDRTGKSSISLRIRQVYVFDALQVIVHINFLTYDDCTENLQA